MARTPAVGIMISKREIQRPLRRQSHRPANALIAANPRFRFPSASRLVDACDPGVMLTRHLPARPRNLAMRSLLLARTMAYTGNLLLNQPVATVQRVKL